MSTTQPSSPPTATGTVPYDAAPVNRIVVLVTIACLGGIFVDGYILGVIGGAVVPATDELGLSLLGTGLIAASALIGIFISGLFFGRVADRFGRKRVFFWNLVGFTVVSLLQLFVVGTWDLVALRLVLGLLIGVEYAVGTSLLAEFAPVAKRTVLVGAIGPFWFVGFIAAFVVSHFWDPEAWRWLLASSAVPALIVLLIRLGIPESPRWLQSQGREREAQAIVTRHYGDGYTLHPAVESTTSTTLRDFFVENDWRRVLYAGLFWFCQVGPLFAIFTFINPVLDELGFSGGFGLDLVMNAFQLAGAAFGLWLLYVMTRRGFVIWTFGILAALLLYLGLWVDQPPLLKLIVFSAFVFIIVASNSIQYVYPPEMFSTRFRSTGVGFSAAMSRIGAAGATYLFPLALSAFGASGTLLLLAAFPIVGWIASMLWAPETKHAALDTQVVRIP